MQGTGTNSGFLVDLRATVLPAGHTDVWRIENTRRGPFQKRMGADLEVERSKRAMESGEMAGLAGLKASICPVVDALAWKPHAVRVESPKQVIAREESLIRTLPCS